MAEKIPDTDSSLLRSLLLRSNGRWDDSAWAEFLRLYGPWLEKWCRNVHLQEHEIDDAVQGILTKLLRSLHTYTPEKGRFRAWLCTVAKNTAREVLKKRRKTVSPYQLNPESYEQQQVAEGSMDDFLDRISADFERESKIIDRIKARCRGQEFEAFIKTKIQGKKASEAANDLGISVHGVHTYNKRVKGYIKDVLAEEQNLSDK